MRGVCHVRDVCDVIGVVYGDVCDVCDGCDVWDGCDVRDVCDE